MFLGVTYSPDFSGPAMHAAPFDTKEEAQKWVEDQVNPLTESEDISWDETGETYWPKENDEAYGHMFGRVYTLEPGVSFKIDEYA